MQCSPSSTMTRDFCVGSVYSDEQASIWPSWARSDSDDGRNQTAGFFFRNKFGGTRNANHFTHVKVMLLLPDSNHITWASSVPCCLLSRPPGSRLGNLRHVPSETKELQNFPSQSPSVMTRVPTTQAFFDGMSEAWSMCTLLQATKLSFK